MTAALGMARAAEILDGLRVHLERARRLLLTPPGRLREVWREHGAVVKAVEAGDASGARGAMRHHIEMGRVLLETVARERPGLFSP
jgi:GntR family transcriptional regulator, rspAB operon transcriptional repressor